MSNPVSSVYSLVWTALLVALIAVGGLVTIPFGAIPITLQGMFIALAALVLGPTRGVLAMLLYLAVGFIGLPVFSGGSSGLGVMMGPTGGYLVGYVFFALALGAGGGPKAVPLWRTVALALLAEALLYVCGVVWIMRVLEVPLIKAITIGFVPFIIPDAVKIVAAIAAWRFLLRLRLLPQ